MVVWFGKTRLLSLGSALIALLYAAPVSAECAWVLWVKNESLMFYSGKPLEESRRWEIQMAAVKIEQCEQVKRKIWSVFAKECDDPARCKGIEEFQKVPYEGVFRRFKSGGDLYAGSWNTTLVCLPDTVDPRK